MLTTVFSTRWPTATSWPPPPQTPASSPVTLHTYTWAYVWWWCTAWLERAWSRRMKTKHWMLSMLTSSPINPPRHGTDSIEASGKFARNSNALVHASHWTASNGSYMAICKDSTFTQISLCHIQDPLVDLISELILKMSIVIIVISKI